MFRYLVWSEPLNLPQIQFTQLQVSFHHTSLVFTYSSISCFIWCERLATTFREIMVSYNPEENPRNTICMTHLSPCVHTPRHGTLQGQKLPSYQLISTPYPPDTLQHTISFSLQPNRKQTLLTVHSGTISSQCWYNGKRVLDFYLTLRKALLQA